MIDKAELWLKCHSFLPLAVIFAREETYRSTASTQFAESFQGSELSSKYSFFVTVEIYGRRVGEQRKTFAPSLRKTGETLSSRSPVPDL